MVFVVRANEDVRTVHIDDLKDIEELIETWRQAVVNDKPAAQDKAAHQLHTLLWQPLQRRLGEAHTILISPDGALSRFPFAALPGQQPGGYLLQDLAIGSVTSGRQLVDLLQPADKALAPPAGLLAIGGEFYKGLWRQDKALGKLEALRQAQLFVLKNPDRVVERARELQTQLAKRGLGEDGLRAPKRDVVRVLDDGKGRAETRRSPASWWAAFVLSGETGEQRK